MISWPSLKMSAETATCSPTTRLTGERPPSISGETRLDDDATFARRRGGSGGLCHHPPLGGEDADLAGREIEARAGEELDGLRLGG